jgi:hypothetical protein
MPKLYHQHKSISSVKARAKIKLERDLGPEILAALADPKNHRNYAEFGWQERQST